MSYISEKTELLKNRRFKGEQKPFLQNLVTNEVFASKDRAYITSELRLAGQWYGLSRCEAFHTPS